MAAITPAPGSLAEALAQIPDPRRSHLRVHGLVALLQMAVAAMLCGARSLYAIAQWGPERREDDPALLCDVQLAAYAGSAGKIDIIGTPSYNL